MAGASDAERPRDESWRRRRAEELDAFHRILFDAPAPEPLLLRYLEAYSRFSALESTAPLVDRLIASHSDLEAIELAARLRDPDNPLTRRLKVLSYLAEARREYAAHFYAPPPGRLRGFVLLCVAAMRTAFKFSIGAVRRSELDGR
ncbi:MAG TPA: hypothetical protein VF580_00970 [Thermoanaerobaculia bacterium]